MEFQAYNQSATRRHGQEERRVFPLPSRWSLSSFVFSSLGTWCQEELSNPLASRFSLRLICSLSSNSELLLSFSLAAVSLTSSDPVLITQPTQEIGIIKISCLIWSVPDPSQLPLNLPFRIPMMSDPPMQWTDHTSCYITWTNASRRSWNWVKEWKLYSLQAYIVIPYPVTPDSVSDQTCFVFCNVFYINFIFAFLFRLPVSECPHEMNCNSLNPHEQTYETLVWKSSTNWEIKMGCTWTFKNVPQQTCANEDAVLVPEGINVMRGQVAKSSKLSEETQESFESQVPWTNRLLSWMNWYQSWLQNATPGKT